MCFHGTRGFAAHQEQAGQVNPEQRVPGLEAVLVDGLPFGGWHTNAGVVDQDVNPAKLLKDTGNASHHAVGLANVQRKAEAPSTRVGRGGCPVGIKIGIHHACAVARQRIGNGLTNALRRAGHQRDFAIEFDFHRSPCCLIRKMLARR